MSNVIGIDVGGTFSDCYVRYKDRSVMGKSPTTPYNLSVGLTQALEDAANQLGISAEQLLKEIEFIFYSTTVALNTLIQRKGPQLCYITTLGFEDTLARGRGSRWQDGLTLREKKTLPAMFKPEPLVSRELTIGVRERVDQLGNIVWPLDEEHFRGELHRVVGKGVRGFAICLLFSYLNPVHERRLKEIIEEEYPDYCLGGVPVVLSSEVLPKQGEYGRAMTTILNAYLHEAMSRDLSQITGRFKEKGYQKSLKMIHNTGGVAEPFSTMAIQTCNGGPVAGLIGGAHISRTLYGSRSSLLTDMGGTSFDMGVIVEGSPRFYTFWPVIDRWLTGITTLESRSIGAGGGSIARINIFSRMLEVGPQSASAVPGPACYDRGGEEPTVTDADVVLGYLDPEYFLGGKVRLNRDKAYRSLRKIADFFKVDVEQAALMVKKVIDANMGNNLYRETVLRGFNPKDFLLFAFGGAGPTHCCGYNEAIGAEKIIVFPYASCFCALGAILMDIRRTYEQSRYFVLTRPMSMEFVIDLEAFNQVVGGLQEKAVRDLVADRIDPESAVYNLELDMKFAGNIHTLRCHSPRLFLRSQEDARILYEAFLKEFEEVFSRMSLLPRAGVVISNFTLHTTVVRPKPEFPRFKPGKADPRAAFKRKRAVFWESGNAFRDTPIYEMNALECGNTLEGPAVIEAAHTTAVVPPGYRYRVDEYLNGIIEGNI